MNRQSTLDAVRANPRVSVLIVGGGINGIGTFRDLALQGVDVLLVERGDFCSGASAASSHMVHGGIRYLENGEFRLVNEALHERNRLLLNAPHYVKPLPTTIPIFKRFSGLLNAPLKFLRLLDKPVERGSLVIKIGLMLYDGYTRDFRVMPTHRFRGRSESLAAYPDLNPSILYTATYYDAWMPVPERLCLELVLDAEQANEKARALNYVSLTGTDGNTVTLRDEMTGEVFSVQPQVVVNAAGPWIDNANSAFGQDTRFIGGTKGSHLVLDHPQLRAAIGDQEFFFENNDGRIVLILPYLDRVLVGTSDIPIENADDARVTEEEIDYFLGMIRKVFPEVRVQRSDIVFGFTGVRPLPASDASTAGQISRDHSLRITEATEERPFPIYSMVGGKWTSFRAFAEESSDSVLAALKQPRITDTRKTAIGGGRDYPDSDEARKALITSLHHRVELPQERVGILFDRYGTRAKEIAIYIGEGEDQPLTHAPDYSQREIAFLATQEKVTRLADIVLRRTLLAMQGRASEPLIEELSTITGEALGWSKDRCQEEVNHTIQLMRDQYLTTLPEA